MAYEKLSKFFYKYGKEKFLEEYKKRIDDYGSYVTDLTIRPFRKGNVMNQEETLFFVNIPPFAIIRKSINE
ncbi:hypothetical protein SAMN05880501_11840 [Ureibacillus xyleni]|uniref:Uncharacterized protein n=1 Tax=Ureibacillus xyleni TaxID=614648 RepID=A0A285TQD3_9BACL|nr:hypothetical protein [Ureibacillus xyleni]SOC25206.1 hypothetical protein SAMN05880501_11840 [Ureibacillus xyleni]